MAVSSDIAPPLEARCPWQRPYSLRNLWACVPSFRTPSGFAVVTKTSAAFRGLLQNNHKKHIRPSFCHNQQHPAHLRFFPFHGATIAFPYLLPQLCFYLLAHSRSLWRFTFFSKRAFNAVSSFSDCWGDSSFFVLTPFIQVSFLEPLNAYVVGRVDSDYFERRARITSQIFRAMKSAT